MQIDAGLLHEVMNNLISNAIRYGAHDGNGVVRVTIDRAHGSELNNRQWNSFSTPRGLLHDTEYVLISVADNGIGIPQNVQGKIFTKFFRAHNAKEVSEDGTGLGLYVIKTIIETSGGSVWFESEEGKGTTFYVALPLEGMRAKDGERGLAVRQSNGKK
jgi:signal transduction histidine kinase